MSRLAERITDLSLKDDLQEAIDDALRTCGGDPRTAIGALILGQRSLQEAYADRISAGYVRRDLFK
ncbi:hypothetical protein [Aureimonas ureilytica]|uniref:hypothetical protein n=1 Tax=Aureimonas ureilytica TaxID=401562 RepID=UPI00037A0CA8|nr:hypothetical protein [Aureimonas ureilytica]